MKPEMENALNELNAAWAEANERATALGVFTDVKYDIEQGGECLAWTHCKGRWCICYGDGRDARPVTDCSVDVRIDCARYVSDLLASIAEEEPVLKERILKATRNLKSYFAVRDSIKGQS